MTMLLANLYLPSVRYRTDSTANFDLNLHMFKHSGTYWLVHCIRLLQHVPVLYLFLLYDYNSMSNLISQ